MIKDSSKLSKGQKLRVDLVRVRDRLPTNLIEKLSEDPFGYLIGFKMVDGNAFGLVLDLGGGVTSWFFEEELSELSEE